MPPSVVTPDQVDQKQEAKESLSNFSPVRDALFGLARGKALQDAKFPIDV
jgi:hypothetical protein